MMGGLSCPNKNGDQDYRFSHWIQECDKYINWAVALLFVDWNIHDISTNVGKTTSAPNIVPKVLMKQSCLCFMWIYCNVVYE